MIYKGKYLLHEYFWSGAAIVCCFGWIQWQLFKCFYWEYFCFLHDIILKEDGNASNPQSASNPHCHSRLSKQILKILFIYRKNNLGKQLSQALCSKYVFRLLHAPKFHVFCTKLNMMVKVVKLVTGVLWKSFSDEFCWKKSMRKSLF